MRIPFNKPFIIGSELDYIQQAVDRGHLTGNGHFTRLCHDFFQDRYQFGRCWLSQSCTDALEMSALLSRIEPGDEVILPSYTFVSTANAFALRGATLRFADSMPDHPNIAISEIERLINPRTKLIVIVHYAGVAVDMDPLMELCAKHGIILVEDCAHAIESSYKAKPLGSFAPLSCFSFHETKNVISGEGGMLAVNDSSYFDRTDIIWEKGTNRRAFFKGQVDKYQWVDLGSSFLPSELTAAFLYAQLENLEQIQTKRISIWNYYHESLQELEKEGRLSLPLIPDYASNNAHMYYLLCDDQNQRDALISHLKQAGIYAVFHYQSLHRSPFHIDSYEGPDLIHADRFSECLLRLPLFYELEKSEQEEIVSQIKTFYAQ